jgi:hypothetical protein
MKHKHPTLAYLLIAVASIVFSVAQPAAEQTPESNAVALASSLGAIDFTADNNTRGVR